ncbi:MAG: DUF559 domain-containing protein [Alphaproteobacteria bacterium]|nr:DUF559 domain-containing protein [Alphaproteobacteria bacterium]
MPDFVKLAEHKSSFSDHARAKELRKDPTLSERILWAELRIAMRDRGFRFRRQHPIHPYIADFICLKLRLIVEVDGLSHDTRLDQDKRRDAYLRKVGYEVMRFMDEDVMTNREGVVLAILKRAEERMMELNISPKLRASREVIGNCG